MAERPLEPIASAPERRTVPRVSTQTRTIESDEGDALAPGGVHITRSTEIGPDGRTYIIERRTTTTRGSSPMPVRRAEAVEAPRHHDTGFFHRLFKDEER